MGGTDGAPPRLLVRGIAGFLDGEQRLLEVGQSLIVGRSRSAGLSTRNAPALLLRPDRIRVIRSKPFKSVSRRHAAIRYLHPGFVEIQDLSANGTFLDGRRIDCVALTDLAERAHVLELGRQERLYLSLVPAPAPPPASS